MDAIIVSLSSMGTDIGGKKGQGEFSSERVKNLRHVYTGTQPQERNREGSSKRPLNWILIHSFPLCSWGGWEWQHLYNLTVARVRDPVWVPQV